MASLVCVLAACGPESPDDIETRPSASASPVPTPAASSASATETEEPVPFPASTADDTAGASSDSALTITGVRTAVHDGYDRVVLDLEGAGTPGWRVGYVDVATDDPSDRTLDIAGDGTLQVTVIGTAMPTAANGIGPVLTPDYPVLREVNVRGWFEGQDLAFIGLDAPEHPFRVFTLTDPTRLVIDVRHD